jgi:hypothetical protein
MVFLTTNAAFSAQGRGQAGRPAGAGAPSIPTVQGNRPSNPNQSAEHRHQPESSAHSADPTNTHGFENYGQYVAATHVAENLKIDFNLLKVEMVDNKLSLGKAISKLRPGLSGQSIEAEVKKAEAAAKKAQAEDRKRKTTS